MNVKLNILERVLVKISLFSGDLSSFIMDYIHYKHDPEGIYHTIQHGAKGVKEIIFTNEES